MRSGEPQATGTLLLRDLRPGKRLYLLASGTGLAPFMSLIKDPETYERFESVVLVHGVRYRSELAYRISSSGNLRIMNISVKKCATSWCTCRQ